MNTHRNLTSSDWLLLSAYLDNQLSKIEKRQVDERLQTDPEFRQTLDSLRRTSLMLSSLPVHRVPRNFTLKAQSLQPKLIPSFVSILRFSSAAAGLLMVAAFALDLTQKTPLMSVSKAAEDMQPAVAMEAAKMPAAEAPEGKAPMIIFWGAPPQIMGAYGKGGGGGGAEGPGVGGGGAAPGFYGIGGGVGEVPKESIPQAAPLAEMPAPEIVEAQPPAVELQAQAALAPETLTGSGPILGVRAPEERTAADEIVKVPLRQPAARPVIPFRLIEVALAVLMILTAIPAWLLKRK